MKGTLTISVAIAVLIGLFITSAVTPGQTQSRAGGPGIVNEGAQNHPNITRAIHALEAARVDLQDASHDYCGHRAAALEATNAALNQLGAAIACLERRGASTASEPVTREFEPTTATAAGGIERHRYIRAAINALRSARRDLQVAAHEYCGHRAAALEATNAALNQLQLGLACESR
jgi:hypothetical protein